MSNGQLFVRGLVRGFFWGSVMVGMVLLIDLINKEIVMNLPW